MRHDFRKTLILLDFRQDAQERRAVAVRAHAERGQHVLIAVRVIENRQTQLLQIVRALHTPRRFPSRLNRREKQPDQNTDDRNHDQQFNKGKTVTIPAHENLLWLYGILLQQK